MEDGEGWEQKNKEELKLNYFLTTGTRSEAFIFGASTNAFVRHKGLLLSSWEGWDSSPVDCVL